MSRWFRHYAGMMRDEKLVSAALKAKQPVERVIWLWGAILESAAEINEGGRYDLDAAEASHFLHTDEADVLSIFAALEAGGRVLGSCVVKWGDRQFQSDSSAERQKRYRNKQKEEDRGDGEHHGEGIHRNGDGSVTAASRHGDAPETETELDTEAEAERKEETRANALPPADDWPSDFRERFWSRYPNKVGRPAALKKLEIARKSGRVTWVTVMAGLEKYIAKTDDRPWCNPATWIHQDRWNDQPAQVQKAPMDAQKQRSDDALEQLRAFNRSRDEGGREAPRVLPQSDGERSADIHNGPGRIVAVLPAVCDRPTAEREGRAAGDLQVLSDHSGNQGNLRRLG